MSTFKTALILASTLICASTAFAGPKADTNQDGQVTLAEFQAAANGKFITADANLDNQLDSGEIASLRQKRKEKRQAARFERQDLNGDKVLTEDEVSQAKSAREVKRQLKRLERFDTNQDGTVDEAEKAVAKAARKQARSERKGERKSRIRRDANGDGIVTRAEYDAATSALFTRMDANSDGVLTKGEGRKRKHRRRGK